MYLLLTPTGLMTDEIGPTVVEGQIGIIGGVEVAVQDVTTVLILVQSIIGVTVF
jgi:hypothetical protein